ncbi:type IV toxin-antitoxin system AbiEi family antitoxin domain-containing protein [Phytoactinopolyspora halotolerans]|uniref:Type IV toxin-antitoxin system AbiEi family antitoxin domain-containing protein n=1 Tax=Phytoactinopolyspora halotolerans TaxID=1981512 RepID=A0A6L9S4N7_9ACTN|nr:type IV toxin-antitoxin system AbiEi family antitoxin domain-containing protein [Phytoactinopolyspora halotolerans]NEE00059.1 type IV toxin-antitoxin system AbiEi family antitoxin domain-containing protein [Phytoactinopolyspora halotolerans]
MIGVEGVHKVADLLRGGMTRSAIAHALRTGRLVRVRRGVYCESAVWDRSASSPVRRHAIEIHAALLAMGKRGWASGYSAALLLRLPTPKGEPSDVELSFPRRTQSRRSYPGLRVRAATVVEGDVVAIDGVPVTSPTRTALDLGRNRGFAAGLIVADAALRRELTTSRQLEEAARRMSGWRGGSNVRLVAEHASGMRESPGESLSFAAFVDAGIPLPECNVWVVDEGPSGIRSDFLWRAHRLVGEVDGYVKYRDPLWSPRDHVLVNEKKRQLRIEEAGLVVVRWTPTEIMHQPEVVLERIVRQSHVAASMYGVPPLSWG